MPLLAVRHIQDFYRRFPSNDACLEYLFALRFPDVVCPECGRKNAYHRQTHNLCFICTCGCSQFYPRKGTLFENSPLPLTQWFFALFFLWSEKGCVTPAELQRKVHVTYATASRMMKRMRSAMPRKRLTTERPAFESFLASVAKGR